MNKTVTVELPEWAANVTSAFLQMASAAIEREAGKLTCVSMVFVALTPEEAGQNSSVFYVHGSSATPAGGMVHAFDTATMLGGINRTSRSSLEDLLAFMLSKGCPTDQVLGVRDAYGLAADPANYEKGTRVQGFTDQDGAVDRAVERIKGQDLPGGGA